jgi:hypothetical protein
MEYSIEQNAWGVMLRFEFHMVFWAAFCLYGLIFFFKTVKNDGTKE